MYSDRSLSEALQASHAKRPLISVETMANNENPEAPDLNIRDALIAGHEAGNLMEAIEEACRTPGIEEEDVARDLAGLHNDGTIDVVAAFSALKTAEFGFWFFGVRAVFEHALPDIEHEVLAVVRCVAHLVREAGQDLAAGTIVQHLIAFLAKDPDRARKALDGIKADPELITLLPAALIAGCRVDMDTYLEQTLQLIKAKEADTRGQAIFALSRIDWAERKPPPEPVYQSLEQARDSETDDALLAAIATTAAGLIKHDPSQEGRLIDLVDNAISKGEDQAIHAASSLLAMVNKHMPQTLVDRLLPHLNRVRAENTGTIKEIGHAMHRLIRLGKTDIAIQTLEALIAGKELEPAALNSVLHDIQRDAGLLNKAVTRWLLNGDPALCRTAAFLVGGGHGANLPSEVDPAEIDMTDAREVVFLARKVCGHLFMNPVSAGSMLLSLLQLAQDAPARTQIGKLVLNPLLINYPGKARTFINERRNSCSVEVQEVIRQVDVVLEEYFDALRSIDEIPELYPSEAQREAYHRHQSREMEESFKEAEKKSVFLGLVSKQTLLYGRTSVNYVQDGQGNAHRQEIPLQQHSVEFEVPRISQLDPLGLEHQLTVLCSERRQE